MTTTKKQKTWLERVANMNKYERALATLVERRCSHPAGTVCDVDFFHEDGYRMGEYTWVEGEHGLSYTYKGRKKQYNFSYDLTAGQLIEEAVQIMEEQES